jgi:hypothetical protein
MIAIALLTLLAAINPDGWRPAPGVRSTGGNYFLASFV